MRMSHFGAVVVRRNMLVASEAQVVHLVDFLEAQFSRGTLDFSRAEFSGGTVDFYYARFSGGEVDFSTADVWSYPPEFPWTGTPPSGVKLPKVEDQSQA
jgi:hypothetical protein